MSFVDRHRDIEGLLLHERKVLVDDLAKRFGVSEVTIRKDLSALEGRGVLLRTHGGAVIPESPENIVPLHKRALQYANEKRTIARAAAQRVRDGESILLDTGSTTLALARELHGRRLNIITNSISIAYELASDEQITLVVLGGMLRKSSLALIAPTPQVQLREMHVDRAFMGASGFDTEAGFCCQNLIEAETKRAMLSIASEVVILADVTKFSQAEFATFCGLRDVHCVITDAELPTTIISALRKATISIVIAKPFGDQR